MNIETIKNGLAKVALPLKKHAPEILTGVGAVSTVAGTVLCCKATLKVDAVLDAHNETAERITEALDKHPDAYSEEDAKKDTVLNYARTAGNLIKLYAPGALLCVAGIGCMAGSSHILRKRNLGLMAAYKAVDQAWKEYRQRVIDELGADKDREFRFGPRKETIDVVSVDAKGKEKMKPTDIQVVDGVAVSQYARFFDDSSSEWDKNPEYNLMFLKTQEQIANDKLRNRGHLFLNEVYDMLGIKRSQAGQIVGWVYRPDNENHDGDNYVDFGLYDGYTVEKRDFVNGYENVILLDFNVDGVIYDMI